MNNAVQYLLSVFWLVILPFFMGIPLLKKNTKNTMAESFLFGYLVMFSAGEILSLILIFMGQPLHVLVYAFAAVCGLMAFIGVVELLLKFKDWQKIQFREIPYFYLILALVVIGFQMYTLIMYAHFDADDSFYVGTATSGAYTDTIFSVNPYTGKNYLNLSKRYVFSQFPMFAAIISKLTMGLHPAILAHTVFPPIFIGVVYVVQYQMARRWFPEKRDSRGIYLLMTAVLVSYSAYSIKNAAQFQMVRIWQGKGFLSAAFLPFLFLLLFDALQEEKRYRWWVLLFAGLSCCYLSSMGIVLSLVVFAICLFLHLVRFRSILGFLQILLCMLPSLMLAVAYIFF